MVISCSVIETLSGYVSCSVTRMLFAWLFSCSVSDILIG